MALFKKKREDEYQTAQTELNSSQNTKARDRIIFEHLGNDDDRMPYLVDQLKSGNPLVVNFDLLEVAHANKMLAFLAGATYAMDGKTVEINTKVFLFARNIDFLDGTLEEFLANI